jgi:hypothetical protein
MAKTRVVLTNTISVESDGKVRFSPAFQEAIATAISKSLDALDLADSARYTCNESSEVRVVYYFENISGAQAQQLKDAVEKRVSLLAAHGADYDILEMLLERYPNLPDHPRINELVGAFDNLESKIKEINADNKSKPGRATPDLPKFGKEKNLSREEKRKLRDVQLQGRAEGQPKKPFDSAMNPNSDIITPPQDKGNVFDG